MNISAKSRYAVRALVELAERSRRTAAAGPCRSARSPSGASIPPQFLEQVFATLRRSRI